MNDTARNDKSPYDFGKNNKSLRGYVDLLGKIKERIRSSRYEALKAVNRELISLYWGIGRMIVERQKDANWGRSVVE
ncbi:MAG: DUF1016 N-terminal domain-containing protein [Thermoleophilia bacterium]